MTTTASRNLLGSRSIIEEFALSGIRECVLSPGRSIDSSCHRPVGAIGYSKLGCHPMSDPPLSSRSAWLRKWEGPVLLVCTSGTAVANFYPAITEASNSFLPLIVLTADRPPELRGFGAAQTIQQPGIFASHSRWSVDLPSPDGDFPLEAFFRTLACRAVATSQTAPPGPVHLNLPFREPLFDVEDSPPVASDGKAAAKLGPYTRIYPSLARATIDGDKGVSSGGAGS